jgi:hypothetical protein
VFARARANVSLPLPPRHVPSGATASRKKDRFKKTTSPSVNTTAGRRAKKYAMATNLKRTIALNEALLYAANADRPSPLLWSLPPEPTSALLLLFLWLLLLLSLLLLLWLPLVVAKSAAARCTGAVAQGFASKLRVSLSKQAWSKHTTFCARTSLFEACHAREAANRTFSTKEINLSRPSPTDLQRAGEAAADPQADHGV